MTTASPLTVRRTQLGTDHTRPLPLGISVKLPTERGYGAELAVVDVVRGAAAGEFVRSNGLGGPALAQGNEYGLARLRFGHFCKAKGSPDVGDPYRITADCFQTTTADGAVLFDLPVMGRQPEQGLIGESVPVGMTKEGWLVIQVPIDAKDPLLVFHRKHAHSNYVLANTWRPFWFRLSAPDPMQLENACAECRP